MFRIKIHNSFRSKFDIILHQIISIHIPRKKFKYIRFSHFKFQYQCKLFFFYKHICISAKYKPLDVKHMGVGNEFKTARVLAAPIKIVINKTHIQ